MGSDNPFNFNPADADYALAQAYVPEHISGMMVAISRAAPFLIEGYLGYTKENWVILVGYPLEGQFDADHCDTLIKRLREAHHPDYIWFIGPEIPPSLASSCRARQSDHYYRLDLASFTAKSSLRRQVKRAARKLTVEGSRIFESEHQSIVDELMRRQKLPPMIEELYRSMPNYVALCETAYVLNARDSRGTLSAFFIVDTAAKEFDTYMLGCHSKKNYVPHASDLLFAEMIALARQHGKPGINLGLGVNQGIRRFKVKWGGQPYLKYEFCETYFGPPER
ncbi:hypothetical protein ACFLZW_05155, partial [Chloroflexota bacterium]